MKYHYIYKITCLCGSLKDHYYIGKHTTEAIPENCGYAGSGKIIKNYFAKYGKIKNITYIKEILEYNSTKEINAKREKYLIGDLYKQDSLCLNLKAGGDSGGAKGLKRSAETRKKISNSLKGNPKLSHKGKNHPMYGKHVFITDEQRAKLSLALKGKKRTQAECEKIRNRMKGNIPSKETREKISSTLKGHISWNQAKNAKANFIAQYDINGSLIKIWELSKDAFSPYKLADIKKVCDGSRKTAYGYKWEWVTN